MNWCHNIGKDLQHALRTLIANPGMGLVSVLALAIGVGSVTTVFSVVNGVLLSGLPYPDSDRLVMLRIDVEGAQGYPGLSGAEIEALREHGKSFQNLGAMLGYTVALTGAGEMEQLNAASISPHVLPLLGLSPLLGRNFDARDHYLESGAYASLLISYELWQRRFSKDPHIVGRSIEVDNRRRTIVGVLPEGFRIVLGPETNIASQIDIWIPARSNRFTHVHAWRTLGRLRPEVTYVQAEQEVNAIGNRVMKQNPASYGTEGAHFRVIPLNSDIVRDIRPAVLVLFAAAAILLLLSCSNAANLQLARNRARRAEVALRTTLGASRGRIVRQILAESLLTSLLAAAAALLASGAALRGLPLLIELPLKEQIALDWRVMLFALAVGTVCGSLVGLIPAWQATRRDLNELLKSNGRGMAANRLRSALLISQLALALLLLVGAGLMVRTLENLRHVDLGFQPERVLTYKMALNPAEFTSSETQWRLYRFLLEQAEALPGVESAGGIRRLPFQGDQFVSGYARQEESQSEFLSRSASYDWVLPGYFESMGIRLVEGRLFHEFDNELDRPVVVIDQDLARQAWPGEIALGKQLVVDADFGQMNLQRAEVIGVVQHVRSQQIRSAGLPQIYLPFRRLRSRSGAMNIVLSVSGGFEGLAPQIRKMASELGGGRPVHDIRPMRQYVLEVTAATRSAIGLLGALALAALVLAAAGAYGVVTYSVSQRSREIGIRMAVGARRRAILGMIFAQLARGVLPALLLGTLSAVALSRLIEGWLFDVSATDPATLAAAALFLTFVTLLCCCLPAHQATRVDPLKALRAE